MRSARSDVAPALRRPQPTTYEDVNAIPNCLAYLYVDEIGREFGVEVKDQPWGTREVWLEDPEGNRLLIGQRVETT